MAIILLLFYGPIPQDQEYHDFADKREIFGIPHFLDVITNLLFLAPGIWGLYLSSKYEKRWPKIIFKTIFTGFILLTFGSGYYHWQPNNFGLMLDRIPIGIIILAFFTLILYDCIGKQIAKQLFVPLQMFGVISVIYWYITEVYHSGDLRPYILVQFFPVIAIPLIIILYNRKVIYLKELIIIFTFFFLARFTEAMDEEIYDGLKLISGHNLKHIFMSVSGIFIAVLAKKRAG